MPDTKPIGGMVVMLLLGSCASGQLARLLPGTDPRIDQAPMSAETKSYARSFFSRPNPKEFALRECEARTRTPCVLFVVDNEIVWRPEGGQPTAAGAPESKPRAANVAPAPKAEAPPAVDPGRAAAAAPEVPPHAARVAIHVASVRDPAEVPRE